jgi:dihydrofolate reductase
MRMSATLTVDLFVSVDGFAGSDGLPGYFGYFGPELESWIAAESAAAHTVLMGRRTYEALASLPAEHRDGSWEAMSKLPTVVFSRTLGAVDWPGARLHRQDAVDEVRRLKTLSDVAPLRTTGSLSLARQLFSAGLVDRLRLLTFPLLAGDAGREPAFTDISATELQLTDTRVLDGRIQLAEYRPTKRDIPRGTEQREPAPGQQPRM